MKPNHSSDKQSAKNAHYSGDNKYQSRQFGKRAFANYPNQSDNLKEQVEEILRGNLLEIKTGKVLEATDKILALIEGLVPPERIKADVTFNMMAEEVLIDDCLVDGYNQCRKDMLTKIKESK